MTMDKDPLLRRLRDADPVPSRSTLGTSTSRAADELLRQITTSDLEASDLSRAPSRRRFVAAVTAALLALLGLTLIVRIAADDSATAAELLHDASVIAANTPGAASQGKYLYAKTVSEQLTTSGTQQEPWSAVLPVTLETWVAGDGSGRHRSEIGDPVFLGPRDRSRWEQVGSPPFGGGFTDTVFPAGSLPYEDVRTLPVGLLELRAELLDQVEGEELPTEVGLFLRVGELLAHADAPPELRSALFEVASQLHGVELLGEVTDPIGRTGVAVGITYTEVGTRLRAVTIFDLRTSAILAQERILLERASWIDADPGTRLSFTAYLKSGRTDSLTRPV